MRITNLEELRKIHQEIKKVYENATKEEIQKNEQMIFDTVEKMLELSRIARKEGLLSLDELIFEIEPDSEEEIVKQLINLVLDGTDAEVVCGIGMARYYTSLYTDYMALRYFIYLEGALSIQTGDNIRILEEKLKSMLPYNVYIEYSKKQLEEKLEFEAKKNENIIEKLCMCERMWNANENGYYISKLLDYVICDMSDKDIQRLLREIDNIRLAMAMKGMGGKARKRIFDNLSERLGKLVAEDMINMQPIRLIDIIEASQKMLTILIRLTENGELNSNFGYLEPFYNVIDVDTKQIKTKNSKISELKELLNEYEKGAQIVKENY